MFKRLLSLTVALTVACCAFAQEAQQAAMERVRTNPKYRWGEARSASQDEAKEKAMEDLVSKLSTTLVMEATLDNDDYRNEVTAVTVGTIENVNEICYREDSQWVCMRYVSEADLRQAVTDRENLISEMVATAQQQEGQLNISEALKYYTWALRMLNTFGDKVKVDAGGSERDAKTWLSAHIPAMLGNIKLAIADNEIVDDPTEYDRYIVNVSATYAGRPVSTLDISYFNGEREVSPVRCKSGEGVLTFHDLAGFKNIDMRVVYDYASEGRLYDKSLAAAYPKSYKRMPFDEAAGLRLPVKVGKDKISGGKQEPVQTAALSTASAADATATAPIIEEPRPTIERNFADNAAAYIKAMQAVEKAIRSKDYQSVRQHFTDEGFRIFELMMGSGTVSVAKNKPEYTVETANSFIIGKSIPVAVKVGRHISKENVVFRFDSQSGKIKSLAYALTQRAENDIFREAQWSADSRYSLLQFMEDYQTAFALKRADYIESIFSDNAIIIVGSMAGNKPAKRFYENVPVEGVQPSNVRYTTFNKDEYITKIKEDFRRKSYIQLTFEDTSISKVGGVEGFADNEVLWIELKQQYSSSNYNDKGFLALQLNMRPSGSLINVRTWTPYFVPMDQLKKSFPIGN